MRRQSDTIRIELERRILTGLSMEWENIICQLEPSLQKDMKEPVFSLRDMKRKLGYWSPVKREICFSRYFVLNNRWDSICDVLRHETAHQLADECFGANEPPHGQVFRKACALLRADPASSGRYQPLTARITKEAPDENDKILMRVKKLMALAESCHQHEAEAAMAKAHTLITKYNIDLISHSTRQNFVSIFIGKPALRHFREEYELSHLLMDNYFVKGIWISAYVVEKEKMGRVLEISGTPQNLRIASYVYEFVKNYIDMQWGLYNNKKQLNRYRKTDFSVGIIQGFTSKLKKNTIIDKFINSKDGSLVKFENSRLNEYYRYRYPNVSTISRTSPGPDAGVLEDGKRFGKKMVIHQGITESGTGSGKLLE